MRSSRFRRALLLAGIVIASMPLGVIANLPTQIENNDEYVGMLPIPEEPDYTDYVEQTYPIDDHYSESQKG